MRWTILLRLVPWLWQIEKHQRLSIALPLNDLWQDPTSTSPVYTMSL